MGSFKILQANIQHAKAATATICRRFAEEKLAMVLIQEPWINGGKIRGLPQKSGKLFYDNRIENPRTAIYADHSLGCIPFHNFISRDLVAVLIEVSTPEGTHEIVCALSLIHI